MAENLIDPNDIHVGVRDFSGERTIRFKLPTWDATKWADWPLLEHFRNKHFPGVLWTKVKVTVDLKSGEILYVGPIPIVSTNPS